MAAGTQAALVTGAPWVPFVGREPELAGIDSALATPGLVIVGGLPGAGKSRLLAEVARRWRRGGVTWLEAGQAIPTPVADRLLVVDDLHTLAPQKERAFLEALAAGGRPVLVASRRRPDTAGLPARIFSLGGLDPDASRALFEMARGALGLAGPMVHGRRTAALPLHFHSNALDALSGHPGSLLLAVSRLGAARGLDARPLLRDLLDPAPGGFSTAVLAALAPLSVPVPAEVLEAVVPGSSAEISEAIRWHYLEPGPEGVELAAAVKSSLGSAAPQARLIRALCAASSSSRLSPRLQAEALRLAAAAEMPAEATAMLAGAGPALLAGGFVAALGQALHYVRLGGELPPELRVLQAEHLVRSGRHGQAASVLATLGAKLPARLADRAELTRAKVELAAGESAKAMERLDRLAASPGPLRAQALRTRADTHYRAMAWELARTDYQQCAEVASGASPDLLDEESAENPDPDALQAALSGLANVSLKSGDTTSAAGYRLRRRALIDPVKVPSLQAASLVNESVAAFAVGDLEKAAALCREAARVRRELGDEAGIALALSNLVQVEAARGRAGPALEAFDAVCCLAPAASPWVLAAAHRGAAWIRAHSGQTVEALSLARRACELARESGDTGEEAECLVTLAETHRAAGDASAAERAAVAALQLARRVGSDSAAADALVTLSSLAMDAADPARALEYAVEARERALTAGAILGHAAGDLAAAEATAAAGNLKGALALCDRALATLVKTGPIPMLTRARELAATFAAALADWGRTWHEATSIAPEARTVRLASLGLRAWAAQLATRDPASAGSAVDESDPLAALGTGSRVEGASDCQWELATVWYHLASGSLELASEALGKLQWTRRTPVERCERALLEAAVHFRSGNPAASVHPLLRASAIPLPGPEYTAILHALEVVVRALGRESEARRWAAQRQPRGHDSSGWLEALGFTGPDLDTRYLVVADHSTAVATVPSDGPKGLEALDLGVDLEGRRLYVSSHGWRSLAGRTRPLEMLALFVREPGRWWTKQAIYEEVWGGRFNPEIHTVNVHGLVRRLRRELHDAGGNPAWLKTDMATGTYSLAAEVRCGLWQGAAPGTRGAK